jgi:hypothetical protein
MLQFEAAITQPAPQNVLKSECSKVANVDKIVYRWPARVHADRVSGLRPEHLNLLRKSVVKAERHSDESASIVTSGPENPVGPEPPLGPKLPMHFACGKSALFSRT